VVREIICKECGVATSIYWVRSDSVIQLNKNNLCDDCEIENILNGIVGEE